MPAKGQKTGYHIQCENCGKEIYQTKTQYNRAKHHFCSNKCQKEFQHTQNFEDRKCEICGNVFHASKKSKQRFCSIQCQGKWQSAQIGQINPRFKRITCNCENCGNQLEIIPADHKRWKYHFCNETCRKEWYSSVYSQSDEWREESRLRAANLLKNNPSTTLTKPQIMVNDFLDEMGIEYSNEEAFEYYSVDNYLIEERLIIEVMGDFWHSNPIRYHYEDLNDIQQKRLVKDKAKHTYIQKYHNIEILYLWERDIYNNADLCRALIHEYVTSKGILKNYHSFNYILDGENLVLKNNIIYPLFTNNTTNA